MLIERPWPRGVRKANLQTDGRQKEPVLAINCESGFLTIPENGKSFNADNIAELDTRPESWELIVKAANQGTVNTALQFSRF